MNDKFKAKIMDKKSNGFTLIEIIVVISILGTIAAIAVPRLTGFKNKAEKSICDANRKTVERMYIVFLLENNHDDSIFSQFLIEKYGNICPISGVISYEDGKVNCSVHEDGNEIDENEPPGDEVPWL